VNGLVEPFLDLSGQGAMLVEVSRLVPDGAKGREPDSPLAQCLVPPILEGSQSGLLCFLNRRPPGQGVNESDNTSLTGRLAGELGARELFSCCCDSYFDAGYRDRVRMHKLGPLDVTVVVWGAKKLASCLQVTAFLARTEFWHPTGRK